MRLLVDNYFFAIKGELLISNLAPKQVNWDKFRLKTVR
jgi:hypothetical protein